MAYLNQCWLKINGIHSIALSEKMHKLCLEKLSFDFTFLNIFRHLLENNDLIP